MRRRPLLLAASGLASLASVLLSVPLVLTQPGATAVAYYAAVAAIPAAWWLAGAVIVIRADGHRVGWLLVLAAVLSGVVLAGLPSASAATHGGPGSPDWATYAVALAYGPALTAFLLAATVLFPDGRIPGPRWRPVVVVPLGVIAISTAGFAVLLAPVGPITVTAGQVPAPIFATLMALDSLGIAVLGFVGMAAVAVRYRRSDGDRRAQLRWLLASVVPAAVIAPISYFEPDQTKASVADALTGVLALLVPLAIGIAILRYRLYDIDRIISRTIGWAIVTGVLVAAFALLVLGLQALIAPLTGEDTLAVAASTLVVAALFGPLRRRVQRTVDRRFDRARYDGERLASAFAERLRDEVGLDAIHADVLATVDLAVRPSRAVLWLRAPGQEGGA